MIVNVYEVPSFGCGSGVFKPPGSLILKELLSFIFSQSECTNTICDAIAEGFCRVNSCWEFRLELFDIGCPRVSTFSELEHDLSNSIIFKCVNHRALVRSLQTLF
jgi:hypothetical protein